MWTDCTRSSTRRFGFLSLALELADEAEQGFVAIAVRKVDERSYHERGLKGLCILDLTCPRKEELHTPPGLVERTPVHQNCVEDEVGADLDLRALLARHPSG